MDKILIVDDTPAVLQALSLVLELHDYDVITTTSPEEAIKLVDQLRIGLVIQDMNFTKDTTSGEEGCELFQRLRGINPHLPIILITAWTDLEQAVALIKAGAADYIAKPWDDNKLITTVANLLEVGKAKRQTAQLARQQEATQDSRSAAQSVGLIYQSHAMQRTVDMAIQVARADISVLITGPNGAGKEKIAELIHAQSSLCNKPFVKVNCGALPADLIEAELFGAEAGAYTGANKTRIGRFEAANGGTLFLDEIGNLSYEGQTKLLRVLQTGEFERLGSVKTQKTQVRLISATNANLAQDIHAGKFREDLFYRLNVIEIPLAPLASRVDDIVPLAHYFLPGRTLSLGAEKALNEYPWPGNVRELENACKRVAVLKPQGVIEANDFSLAPPAFTTAPETTREPDRQALESALREHHGVIARVAREFGLSRQALYRRLAKYGIEY
ncbi:sigma-54-dependent transcriptional regulator [Alteromonas flava]|uniref:sigma-54-dependent transcriptional regulator n=1 Tax=Alteromonas flava TaxID=2048003 RepID=UPI000C29120E|nr:sigma-54 dependent transcriptional regulator [Alteromonas flava]